MRHLDNPTTFVLGFIFAIILTSIFPWLWDVGLYTIMVPLDWIFVRSGVSFVWAILLVFPVVLMFNGVVGGVFALLCKSVVTYFQTRKGENDV